MFALFSSYIERIAQLKKIEVTTHSDINSQGFIRVEKKDEFTIESDLYYFLKLNIIAKYPSKKMSRSK